MKLKKNNTVLTTLLLILFLTVNKSHTVYAQEEIIIDSEMTFEEAIFGSEAPVNIIAELVLLDVEYYSFEGKLHRGQVVVHRAVAADIVEIFEIIKETKFPIAKAIPIVKYNWSDSASMADNNTSAFNYRVVAGTENLSRHSFGKAIDFNPMQNPYISKAGVFSPEDSKYDPTVAGTFTQDNIIVKKFIEKGWVWGGNFKSIKDYHHFDKR